MSYEQHDLFRERLSASPLSAGRRGIAAMVLVEIVRWMPENGSLCAKTVEDLGTLLNLRPGDVLSAIGSLESLGVVEPVRQGPLTRLRLKPLLPAKTAEELQHEVVEAIQYHAAWKRRLRHAIDTGGSDVTVDEAARDDHCEFGRWLNSSCFGDAERDGTYDSIRQLHAQFHRVAAATLQLALSGRKQEAEQALGVTGIYARASQRLTRALSGWRGTAKP